MPKYKKYLLFGAIVAFFSAVIYIVNLPFFSSKKIQMDKSNAAELAKTDFDKGYVRFIETYKENQKVKGSDNRPSGSWVIPAENEIGKAVLEKYGRKTRIEPDYGKDEKTFKREEWAFASTYNRKMLGYVLANDKEMASKRPVQPAKTVSAKSQPPPPIIIDDGAIPMDKVKAAVISKTDIERQKIRFIEVFTEDPKKPGDGKWLVPLEKEIGKEILEQYPDRIRIEGKPEADPKVFKKNELSYASSYNKAMLKFIKPDAPIFTMSAKKPAETAKPTMEKNPEDPAPKPQPATTEKTEEPKKPEIPAEGNQ